jgi:hypothetical protein
MAKRSEAATQVNEGEGNKTAAREYNEAQRRFVESGRVAENARDAERALDGPERRELEQAEAIGKSHVAAEDPRVRVDEDRVRVRAYEIWEREGRPDGKDDEHWHRAAKEIADGT